jgi:hypothetical protein
MIVYNAEIILTLKKNFEQFKLFLLEFQSNIYKHY